MIKSIAFAVGFSIAFAAPATSQNKDLAKNQEPASSGGDAPSKPNVSAPGQNAANSFEMFGVNASKVYSGEIQVANKKCRLKGVGQENCVQMYGAVISDVRLKILAFMFNDGKLFGVYATADGSNFSSVGAAFEAKYGKPISVENGVWQNRAGATFDNVTKTWGFSDGVLKLDARGSNIDEMKFVFASPENSPEAKAPKVNF